MKKLLYSLYINVTNIAKSAHKNYRTPTKEFIPAGRYYSCIFDIQEVKTRMNKKAVAVCCNLINVNDPNAQNFNFYGDNVIRLKIVYTFVSLHLQNFEDYLNHSRGLSVSYSPGCCDPSPIGLVDCIDIKYKPGEKYATISLVYP